ncbi:MAG: ATP phosphoribosyltransferase [Actinobacteria bacterium]|uniref:ATP phosphoribosyltransferase n=1 Tax=freshwater metagenome TaxID=449393 RepID=A0A6J6N253_9ZZZZ|nr:ATP phosphoribosyltransferase [Actinomycetota bacterium]
MLRVAVPNKGILSEFATAMLEEAGYAVRRDAKTLRVLDAEHEIEFFYLRPRDIATYVGTGALDLGLTGLDLLADSRSQAIRVADLNFGKSTFRLAAPAGAFKSVQELSGKRIASAYPSIIEDYLASVGVSATIIKLDGAVETAVSLGVADAVADVVSTGNTLLQAGLEIFGPVILESSAYLIANERSVDKAAGLLRRLNGVVVAREYVIFDYDCPVALLERASVITPGIESPTVSPTKDADWVAVRALVKREDTNSKMDELYDLGARAILVSAIHAARI